MSMSWRLSWHVRMNYEFLPDDKINELLAMMMMREVATILILNETAAKI